MSIGVKIITRLYSQNYKNTQRVIAIFLLFTYFFNTTAYAASEIVGSNNGYAPDITQNVNVYDVNTQKYVNGAGVNSFDRFNVDVGDIVNLNFNADRLINLIYDSSASQINGEVNAFSRGVIGGNVLFANSNGFVVGSSGIFNVGSLSLIAPTRSDMDDLFMWTGEIDGTKLNKLMDFDFNTSDNGAITFDGKVNAIRGVGIIGSEVDIGKTAEITANKNLDITDTLVNTASTEVGIAAVENGKVVIKSILSPDADESSADSIVNIAGKVKANGADVDVLSYSNVGGKDAIININDGADISGRTINMQAFNEVDATSRSVGLGLNLDDYNLGFLSTDVFSAKQPKANAQLTIHSGSSITALKDLNLEAKTKLNAGETVYSPVVAIYIGEAVADTGVTVNSGATLSAAENINISASSENTMDSTPKASSLGKIGSIVVTISSIKNTTSAIVNSGAVTKAKNLSVKAESKNEIKASTSNKVLPIGDSNNGNFGVSVVVADVESTTIAKVNNNSTLTGDLNVNAKTTTTAQTSTEAAAGGKGDDKDNKVVGWLKSTIGPAALVSNPSGKLSKAYNSKVQDATRVGDGSQAQFNKIDLTAAVNYTSTDVTTTASIGDDTAAPTITAKTINVNAESINDKSMVSASSEASDAKVAIGGAVAINSIKNTTDAFIKGNITSTTTEVKIEDGKNIPVTGITVTASNIINHPLSYYDDWNEFMTDEFKSIFTGVAFSQIGEQIGDNLDGIDFTFYNPSDYVAAIDGITTPIKDTLGAAVPSFDVFTNLANTTSFGLEKLFTTYALGTNSAQTKGDGATTSVAATVAITDINNSANAYIAPGSTITSHNEVKINASNDTDNWSMAGLFKLSNITSMLNGNSAENGSAVGGSITISMTDDNASAYIGDNATVNVTDGTAVLSSTSEENIVTASAGSSTGDKAGISGSVAVTNVTGTTQSYIDKNVVLNADNLDMSSKSNPLIVALTLGAASSQQGALGVGVSVINLDNIIKSYIDDSGTTAGVTLDSTTKNSELIAESSPFIVNVTVSGAKANPAKTADGTTPEPKPSGGNNGTGGTAGPDGSAQSMKDYGEWKTNYNNVLDELKAKFAEQQKNIDESGTVKPSELAKDKTTSLDSMTDTSSEKNNKFSIAGAGGVNVNVIGNEVSAYVNDGAKVNSANNLKVEAKSSVGSIDISTGLAYAGKIAAGGAATVDWFKNSVSAYIGKNALVDVKNSLDVKASETDDVIQVNLGVAAGKDNTGVSGSVGVLLADNEVKAYINEGAKVNTTDTGNKETQKVSVTAKDTTEIVRGAGAGAYGKNAGVGLTVGVNVLANTTQAYIANNAEVNAKKSLDVKAETTDHILTIGVGGAGSEKVAVAGVAGVDVLANKTESYISGATINNAAHQVEKSASQSVNVVASETSKVINITGAGAGSKSMGFGLSSTTSVLSNEINSYILNSTVNAAGDVKLDNDNTVKAIEIVASGAGGKTAGAAGAVGVFVYNTDLNNYISGSTVNANNVLLESDDTSKIISVTGSGAGGKEAGVGAAIFVTVNNNDINTYINNSSNITALNNVTLNGTATHDLIDVVASGAGGGTAGITAGIGVNVETGSNNSYIDNSTVTAQGTDIGDGISVKARSDSNIISVVGQGNYGGTASVGGSTNTVISTKSVNAYVNNSTLTSSKDVNVSSEANEKVISAVVGLGVGGDAGVQGAFDTYVITNAVNSYISGSTVNVDGNTNVYAKNYDDIISAAGSISGSNTAAIGASVISIVVAGDVNSYIGNSTMNSKGDINLTADSKEFVIPVAVSGGGAGSVAVNASLNTIVITRNTETALDKVTATQKSAGDATLNDINMSATSTSILGSQTGQANGSGSVGVGGSVDTIVLTKSVKSQIRNGSNIDAKGEINLNSTSTDINGIPLDSSGKVVTDGTTSIASYVPSITVGISGSGEAAVQGSDVSRIITNEIESSIKDSIINTTGDVTLNSAEDLTLSSVIASIAGSASASVGASIYTAVISTDVNSFIQGSTFDSTGNVTLNATSSEDIQVGSASIAGAEYAGITGIVNTIVVTNSTNAYIDSTTHTAGKTSGNTLSLKAQDDTEITVMTGQISGAIAGVGGNVDTTVIDKSVKSEIRNGSDIKTTGLLSLDATSSENLNAVAAAIAGGGVGAQGLVSTKVISNTVQSLISGDTTEIEAGSSNIHAKNTTNILGALGAATAGGTAVGATVAVNVINNTVEAYIANKSTDVTGILDIKAEAEENIGKGTITGSDIGMIVVSGAAGGSATTGAVSANIINNSVNAYATSEEHINAGTLNVTASDVAKIHANAGSALVSFGGGGYGASIIPSVITNSVTAYVDGTVNAGDLNINANSTQDLLTLAVGFAGSSDIGLSGSVVTNVIDTQTKAYITDNSHVTASNNIAISATDTSNIDVLAGAGAIGSAGAVGASVIVNVVNKDVEAYVGQSAVVDADNKTSISATAVENIGQKDLGAFIGRNDDKSTKGVYAVAGSLGGMVGVAGTVIVNSINNTVKAAVKPNARLNQNNSATAKAEQSVSLSAKDTTNINAATGAGAAGMVGVGASVNVNVISNTVNSYAGQASQVNAKKDVEIKAESAENLDSKAIAFAGGVVSIAGAISVASIGNNVNPAANNKLSENSSSVNAVNAAQSQTNNALSKGQTSYTEVIGTAKNKATTASSQTQTKASNAISSGTSGTNITVTGNSASADYAAPANYIDSTTSTLQFNDTTRKGATSAFIDSDATVKAGENITVAAKNDNNVSLLTGSATAGAYVSVGASVGVADINTTTEAYINAGATVESDGDTRITSNSTDTSTVKSYAGSGVGIVAANGSVAYLNSNKITRSYTVDDNVSGVSFNNADNLIISATSSTNDTVEAHGASAGIAALGASVAIASGTGTTTATLGKNTKIGKDSEKSVKNLTVSASSTDSVSSKAQGGVVGVVGAGVTYAETSIKPYVTAYINDYADITLDGYMTVEASENVTKATSESYGLNIGGFSVGVSQAITNVGDTSKKTESKIGSNSTINTGGNATVKTTFTTSNVSSSAKTGAYGLVGGNGSLANTNVKNVINSYIADATTLTAGGTLTIQNNVVNSASSKADGRAYGLVAGGYTEAANEINTTSNAYIANNSTAKNINAGNVSIVSNVTNNATANTSAGSGGLASGLGAKSQSKITSNNNAYTGSNLNLNSAGNIGISAATNNNYKSSIDASSYGAIAGGAPQVVNSITSNVNVYTGANSATIAGNNITVDAYNSTRKPDNGYNLYGGSGGVATYGAGEITSSITHTTNTTLNGNLIKSGANTKASAKNDIDITEKADTEAYGGIPKTDTSIEETIRSSATVKAQAANITAGRDISLLAYSNTYAYAKSNVYAGGVAPIASGEATIRNTNSNTIDIPTGTNLFAERNLTLQAGGGNSIINAIVNTNSDGLLWNFGDMDADASQTISNNINIASGSNVKAGEELDLWSLAGYYYADGYYKGKTRFYIVFGIPITKYKYGGDGGTSISNYITLNGNAESGVYNEKTLTLSYEDASDPDSIKTSGEGITMGSETAVPYSQKELFEDKRDELIKQRNEVLSGDPDSDTSAAGGMNADLATLQLTRTHADEAKTEAITAKDAFDNAVADFNTNYAGLTAPSGSTIEQAQMEAISKFASDNSLTIAPPDGSKPAAEQVAQMKASLESAINDKKSNLGNDVTSTTNAYETADKAVQAQEKAVSDYKEGMDARIEYWDTLANSPDAGTAFYYLPVNAVSIGTGLTSIKGNLTGTGKITAPGNVFRIDVQNNTTKSLLFHNLSINKDADGRIFYNGTTYNNDANIGGVTLDIRNPGKNVKEIVINNAYDPDNPHNPLNLNITDTELSGNSGDLYFTGDISNPGGDVRITNMTGSVVTEGQISAKNYFLYVPRGAYIQNFSSGVFNSAGSAREGSIIAGQDVTIIAQMINVNGLIQSGEADKQITINDFDTPVAYYDESGKLLGYKVNGVALGEETLSTGDVICDMLTAYITGDSNIKAFWDGEKIQVFRSEIRGGNITLNGEIISTGNGVLKVVSGYGEINVENKSSHDMVINKLSADRKIDGKVILNNREISNTLASKLIDLLQNDKAGYNALMYNDGYFENNVPITSLISANYIYKEGDYSGAVPLTGVTYDPVTNKITATYSGTVTDPWFFGLWGHTKNVSVTKTFEFGKDFTLSNITGSGADTKATVTYKAVFDPANNLTISRNLDEAGHSTINIDAGSKLTTHVGASTSRNFSVANLSVADGASGDSLLYYPQPGSRALSVTKSDPIYVPRSAFIEWLLGKQYVYNYTITGTGAAATSPISIKFTGHTTPNINIATTGAGASNIYINEGVFCINGNIVINNDSGGGILEYALAQNDGYTVTNNAVVQGKNIILRTTGDGMIGEEGNPLLVNTGYDGSLYIAAGGDINVKAPTADLNLMAATSAKGNVTLEANREIVASSNAALANLVNSKGLDSSLLGVSGKDINLISNNAYVNADNTVTIDGKAGLTLNATGKISATAQDDIYIRNSAPNTKVGEITSKAGDVYVTASGSIEAAELIDTQSYNISGKDIYLTAENGKIGEAEDTKELIVNGTGKLTATATEEIGIRSLVDIFVNKITTAKTRDIRLVSDKNIKNANNFKSIALDDNDPVIETDSNIVGNNLFIAAIGGGIDDINVELDGEITAYAGYSVDGTTRVNADSKLIISNVNSIIDDSSITNAAEGLLQLNDLKIKEIKSTGNTLLESEKSILGYNTGDVDVRSNDMTLLAYNGSVGSALDYLNIVSAGNITANATDSVYINSPEDIRIKEIKAVQDSSSDIKPVLNNVYITSDKSILDGSQTGESSNIVAKYINLLARDGSIGALSDALDIALFGDGNGIEATAISTGGSIYLASADTDIHAINVIADVNIGITAANAGIIADSLNAGDEITLTADKDITGTEHGGANIISGGNTIMSSAGGSIGSADNLLDVSIDGTLTAQAADSVYINSLKELNVVEISGLANGGYLNNLKLTSAKSILNRAPDQRYNIKANNVDLFTFNSLGEEDKRLRLDFGSQGTLSASAIDDMYLDMKGGSVTVKNMETTSDIYLDAEVGTLRFGKLRAENAYIRNKSPNLAIEDGIINTCADIYTSDKYGVINNKSIAQRQDSTIQMKLYKKPFHLVFDSSNNIRANAENAIWVASGYKLNGETTRKSMESVVVTDNFTHNNNSPNPNDLDNNLNNSGNAALEEQVNDSKGLPPEKFVRWTDQSPQIVEGLEMLKFASQDEANAPKLLQVLSDIKEAIGEETANEYYESIKPMIKGNRWYDKNPTVSQIVELIKLLPPETQAEILGKISSMVINGN